MAGFSFFLSHSLLFVCLVGMGSLLHDVSAGLTWDEDQRCLFLIFSGSFLFAISMLSLAHEGVGRGLRLLKKEIRIGVRLIIGSILIAMGALDGMMPYNDSVSIIMVVILFGVDFVIEVRRCESRYNVAPST